MALEGKITFSVDKKKKDSVNRKQGRQQVRRERHKTVGLMSEKDRSARAFYILVNFFPSPSKYERETRGPKCCLEHERRPEIFFPGCLLFSPLTVIKLIQNGCNKDNLFFTHAYMCNIRHRCLSSLVVSEVCVTRLL